MSLRVIVNGAQGKMGQLACETLKQHPQFNFIAGLSRGDDLASIIQQHQVDIVVDLTRADCVYENCLIIIEQGAHPVVGTTGLSNEQILELQRRCATKKLGGIIAPNFSVGAILMMRFAQLAAAYLPDVEIIEAHHAQKFDAPSGTAKKTVEMIAEHRQPPSLKSSENESITGVRGGLYQNIPIHSIRLPGFLAHQQVIFGNQGETLSIVHNSIDRSCFMPGIVLCCQKVSALNTLYYGMEHLLT